MKTTTILGLAIAAMVIAAPTCEAARGGIIIGKQENLHRLADVPLKGPRGEDLVLSFKTSMLVLGLGLYCKDDGYVLTKASDPNAYFALPESATVAQMQATGLLPRPLPSYKVPAWEYAAGYSLWWIALIAAGCLTLKDWSLDIFRWLKERLTRGKV